MEVACGGGISSEPRVSQHLRLSCAGSRILEFDRMIIAWHRSHEASKRLDAIPGVGPVLATALIASIADPKAFLAFTRAPCLLG